MRVIVIVSCALLLLLSTTSTAGAYYDDSIVIEIEGGYVPPDPPELPPGGGGTGSGGSGAGGGSSSSGGSGSSGVGTDGNSSIPTYGPNTGNGTQPGNTPPPDDPYSAHNTLFDLLVTQGAIGGNATPGSGSVGGGSASGSEGDLTINAARLRAALRGNSSYRQILDEIRGGSWSSTYRRDFSGRNLGLIAASITLEDAHIDELTFGATKFEVVYRSRGYLLGFIPKTFPTRITINPQASVAGERVVLKLPWYRFFIRKLFSPSTLVREIDDVVTADARTEGDTAADIQVRLLEAVSSLLKKKVGSV